MSKSNLIGTVKHDFIRYGISNMVYKYLKS
jgi:hypothetical protein